MRQLLEGYDCVNLQTNAVLRKLFLDKLPAQVQGILAASLENNFDSLARRATVTSKANRTGYFVIIAFN